MKKTITLLALCLIGTISFAQQAPAIQWQKCFGGTSGDQAYSIQPTPDGGYILAGATQSNDGNVIGNHGGGIYNNDAWVVKLSATGTLEWQKCLGGTGDDWARSIHTTPDGGYIVACIAQSIDGDVIGGHGYAAEAWVVKLSATGTIVWQKPLGGTGYEHAYSIQPTSDGGYIMAGVANSTDGDVTGNHGGYDAWVVKISSTGNLQWQKSLGGTLNDQANSIQPTTDGGYIIAGETSSNDGYVTGNHGGRDAWVAKLSSTGTLEWQKVLGGTGIDQAYSIQPTSDGSYIVAGETQSTDGDVTGNHGMSDAWVVKLSASGALVWQKALGGTNTEYANSIVLTSDGGYIMAGVARSNNGDLTGNYGFNDVWVVKLAATGNLVWQKTVGGTNNEAAQAIQPTFDGGYIIAGYTDSIGGDVTGNIDGGLAFWVVKLGPELSTTGFVKEAIVVYPNPAKTLLTVQNNHQTPFEKIVITDLMGKIVLTQTAPNAQVNVAALANGLYIVTAFSGEEQWVSKFVKE